MSSLTIGFVSYNARLCHVKFCIFAEENRDLIKSVNSFTGRIRLNDGTEIIKISDWEQLRGRRLDQVILAVDGDLEKFVFRGMDDVMWYWLNRALMFSCVPDEFRFQQYGDTEEKFREVTQ